MDKKKAERFLQLQKGFMTLLELFAQGFAADIQRQGAADFVATAAASAVATFLARHGAKQADIAKVFGDWSEELRNGDSALRQEATVRIASGVKPD